MATDFHYPTQKSMFNWYSVYQHSQLKQNETFYSQPRPAFSKFRLWKINKLIKRKKLYRKIKPH